MERTAWHGVNKPSQKLYKLTDVLPFKYKQGSVRDLGGGIYAIFGSSAVRY
ncbi:MAG: hypothetical protein QT07_C0006G0041 [archaeon GW2011_AR16]|nr:MAG: hypothetical protein QT07_C0006G0041 [archaeon GW2011_AR16]